MNLIKCDFCENQVDKKKIKYIPLDNNKIKIKCFNCLDLNKKEIKTKNLIFYSCRRCDYDFRHDIDSEISLKCPYCGKKDQLEKKDFIKKI